MKAEGTVGAPTCFLQLNIRKHIISETAKNDKTWSPVAIEKNSEGTLQINLFDLGSYPTEYI
jgi:hypothetical protein